MDLAHVRDIAEMVQMAVVVVLAWHSWAMRRSVATRAAIDELASRHDEVLRRVDRLETHADNAPSHEDLATLHERINELSGSLRELIGVMSGVQRSLDRVETKLMKE